MTRRVGSASLLLALLVAVSGMVLPIVWARTGRDRFFGATVGAILAQFALVTLAALALVGALVATDLSIRYVAMNTTRATPVYYRVTGLWGALEGSRLLWEWLLVIFAALVAWQYRGRERTLLPEDANMLTHPPLLHTGFVGLTVPYAFAVAALVTGKLDDGWVVATRRWTLIAWVFLSMGNLVGAWWSYHVLGRGGYWAWDPVENAAFMPWLPATAFLHSIQIQERRGMLKTWNLILIVLAFALTIFGTFLTRSGILSTEGGHRSVATPSSRRCTRSSGRGSLTAGQPGHQARGHDAMSTLRRATTLVVCLVLGGFVTVHGQETPRPLPDGARGVTIELTNFAFRPDTITVEAGRRISITAVGKSIAPHNVTIMSPGGEKLVDVDVPRRQTRTFDVTLPRPGTYQLYCDVFLHRQFGMEGVLVAR